jgi:P4 family phage/plasmid primase-like protien
MTTVDAPVLMPAHVRELEESCITETVRDARRYETLYGTDDDRARLKELRVPRWAWRDELAFPALLLPMYRVTGEEIGVQFKPAVPQEAPGGKLQKYASQSGTPNRLDVPPAVADAVRDPSEPLWVTEGIKKADCLASYGRAVITLTGVFNWRSKLGTLGDWEDVPLQGRTVVVCFDADTREKRTVMLAMQRFGRWLESKQARVMYLIVPPAVERADGSTVPVKGVDDFLRAGGTMEGLRDATAAQLPTGTQDASFTDAVLTDTLVNEALEGSYRWALGLGWMRWTGKRWEEASDAAVMETVRQWALEQFNRVLEDQRRDANRDLRSLIDGWRGVLSAAKLGNLVRLARGPLECAATDFDADMDLINCPNGIVDLRTGVLTPHDPDALMTKLAGADYVKGARHPDWDTALEGLPADVLDWYRIRIGQAFTGHMTSDDMVLIQQGGGSNGKSTVADALAAVAGKRGGYYCMVSDRVILGAASDNHPTEIMDLMGARYAVLEETPEARRLDTNRLKKLAGTPEITGRHIRKDSVTFPATHSLFVNSNYKPMVDETDHGTWRRLALVRWPFRYRKPGEALEGPDDRRGDPTLRERIKQDPQALEAALAWVVEGARRWYELNRIMPLVPETVGADTLAWRKESDPVLSFIDEHLEYDLDACVAGAELRSVFNNWLKEKGAREWGDKTLLARFGGHEALSAHGVVYKLIKNPRKLSKIGSTGPHQGSVRAWIGLAWSGGSGETAETDNPGKDPFTGGEPRSGNRSNTCPVNGNSVPRIRVNRASVTPVTENSCTPKTEPGETDETTMDEYGPDPFAALPEDVCGPPAPPSLEGVVAFDIESPSADSLFTFRSGDGAPFARLNGLRDETGKEIITTDPAELVAVLDRAESFTAHNGFRFDLMALALHHGADYDALAPKMWDTYVDATVVDPPGAKGQKPWAQEGYYSLDKLAERLGEPGKTDRLPELAREYGDPSLAGKEREKDGYGKIPVDLPRYREYLSGDLRAQGRVHRRLTGGGERMDYRRREQRVAYIQNRMTLSGWKVDVPLLDRLVRQEKEKVTESLRWLHENCGVPLTETRTRGRGAAKETYEEPRKSPLGSNAGKEALIRAFADRGAYAVPRTESGVLALNKDALGEGSYMVGKGASGSLRPGMLNPRVLGAFAERGADVDALREMCEHIKLVTTSVQKYGEIQSHLIGDRVHARVGETQGSRRWAMVTPSVTNMGKRGGKAAQRAPMIADDGCVLICFDFDQVDMRAFAGHCGDPEYVDMFVRGLDPHSMITNMVFGQDNCACPDKTRHACDWRERSKASGHGWNYGLSVNGLVNSGVERALAERFDAGMNEGYPVLCGWRSEVRALAEDGHLLDNGFGALLRCDPKRAYTQAPAQMGQGTARDIMCEGLLRLPQEYIPWLRGVVHDEAVFSVPEGRVEECVATVTAAFTMDLGEITGGRLHSVPVRAGASRPGNNWAACYQKD